MRYPIASLLAALVLLSFLTTASGQQATNKGSTPSDLVQLLGSPKFAERNAAAATLEILGAAALPALEQGLKSPDPEVRKRAEKVRARVHDQVDAARLLAARRMRLTYKDSPVLDAIADLANRTGFPIRFIGDRAALAGRTVTLETGETTFWEAFKLFCAKAGLVEQPLPVMHEMAGTTGEAERSTLVPRGLLALVEGQAKPLPTWLAGKLRLQALPATYPHQKGETAFFLAVTPEPKMPWRAIERLEILQTIDDRGQTLKQPEPYILETPRFLGHPLEAGRWDAGTGGMTMSQTVDQRMLLVRLTCGKQPSTRLQEVRGLLTVKLATPRPVVTVEEVAKAVGKPVKSASGGTVEVTQFKQDETVLRLKVRLQGFPVTSQGGQVIQAVRNKKGFVAVTGSPNSEQPHLTLLDAQGKVLPALTVSSEMTPSPEGGLIRNVTLVYQTKPGQAAPTRLVYSALAPIHVHVPFTLRDVPLVAPK